MTCRIALAVLVFLVGCQKWQLDPARIKAAVSDAAPPTTTDWPGFRGPHRNGISTETAWQTKWPEEGPAKLWTAQVGTGYSSVAVADNRAFTLGNRDGRETVYAFDAGDGKSLWNHSYDCGLVANLHAGGPGATPTIDGDRVYTLSREGHLYCFDAARGDVKWTVHFAVALGSPLPEWGFTSSPLVFENLLIVDAGGLVAFDKADGDVVWRGNKYRAGYGSPVVFAGPQGESLIAALTNDALVVVRPNDGHELAKYDWTSQYVTTGTTPVVSGRALFISSGYGGGCALVEFTGDRLDELYRNDAMSNHMCSSIVWQGKLYGIDGNSHNSRQCKLVCLDLAGGERVWEQRGFGCGAMMLADGKLLILSDEGYLAVAEATPSGYVELAKHKVFDGHTWTMPVLCKGRIYCRSESGEVVCLDVRT